MTVGTPSRKQSGLRHPLVVNTGVTVASVLVCLMLLPSRIPGMELLGVGPHWLLIWVVAWSVKRTMWQGALAGLVLGLLQDAMTAPHPTHTLSLIVVGVLTARLQKTTLSTGRHYLRRSDCFCHGCDCRNRLGVANQPGLSLFS